MDKNSFLYRYRDKGNNRLNRVITPETSSLKLLSYSRLTLNGQREYYPLMTDNSEYFFFIGQGTLIARIREQAIELNSLDGLYVSTNEELSLCSKGTTDIYIVSAPAKTHYPFQAIRYKEVCTNPNLHYYIGAGESNDLREQHIYLYSGIPAARLLFGFARGTIANWSSVPPHKHTESMEEIYIFFDMDNSPCGIQFVYDDDKDLSHSYLVQNEDAVIVPYGYHPNVAFPGKSLNFIWAMAARKENDRKLVIRIEPEFCVDGQVVKEAF